MNSLCFIRKTTLAIAPVGAVVFISFPATGHITHWTSPTGGSFTDPANWDAGVPGAASLAVFDIGAAADVSLSFSAAVNELHALSGATTLLLDGSHLSLNSQLVWTPSLMIAPHAGDAASLTIVDGDVTGGFAVIGDESESYGTLRLESASLALSAHAFIGLGGSGLLELADGSWLFSAATTIGSLAGSIGDVAITGGSQWSVAGAARLGQILGSQGSVAISGDETTWEIFGDLDVGLRDEGTLTISDGAEVVVHGSTYVGRFKKGPTVGAGSNLPQPEPHGHLFVNGAGSQIDVAGDLWISPPTLNTPYNVGEMILSNGGRAIAGGKLHQGGPVRIVLGASDDYTEHPAITANSGAFVYPDAPHIAIELHDGYAPSGGDSFRIITLASAPLSLPPLPKPLSWHVLQTDEVRIHVVFDVKADLNKDGVVNIFDLLALLAAWGPCADPEDCPADLNGDGFVDVVDLVLILANWG